jgi:hypothetical protein
MSRENSTEKAHYKKEMGKEIIIFYFLIVKTIHTKTK